MTPTILDEVEQYLNGIYGSEAVLKSPLSGSVSRIALGRIRVVLFGLRAGVGGGNLRRVDPSFKRGRQCFTDEIVDLVRSF